MNSKLTCQHILSEFIFEQTVLQVSVRSATQECFEEVYFRQWRLQNLKRHCYRQLRRVCGVVEILLGVLAGSIGMTGNVLKVIIDEMAQLSEENLVLGGTIKKLEQGIRIHEIWNHSSAEATEYARNRRQFRKDAKEHRVKGMQVPHDKMQRKTWHLQGCPVYPATTVL